VTIFIVVGVVVAVQSFEVFKVAGLQRFQLAFAPGQGAGVGAQEGVVGVSYCC
jgi:hypothetical protein